MDPDDDELDCPGCDASVDVRRPIGVEVTVLEEPSMTSLPGRVTIAVGGVIVHRCDEADLEAEGLPAGSASCCATTRRLANENSRSRSQASGGTVRVSQFNR